MTVPRVQPTCSSPDLDPHLPLPICRAESRDRLRTLARLPIPVVLGFALVLAAGPFTASSYPAQQTPPRIFEDGMFRPGDWLMTGLQNHPDIRFQAAQLPVGGNPGAFRSIAHHLPAAPAGLSPHAVSLHLYLGGSYAPATEGPIARICFASDVAIIQGFGDGQSQGPAVWQAGRVYVSDAGITGVPAGWEHRNSAHLQDDFHELLPGADRDLDAHPDFSAAGVPVWFGFFRSNTTRLGPNTIEGAIDNWSVVLNCEEDLPATPTPISTLPPTAIASPTLTLTPTIAAPYPGPSEAPTAGPSPSPTPDSVPPATPPPSPAATPAPTPTATAILLPSPTSAFTAPIVCRVVAQAVPPAIINDALANPERYQGWGLRLDPNKPPSPANPLRRSLNLRNPAVAYHPLWNAPVWRAGCS